ncbi:DUF2087 domain-containing protein [Nocardiopsis sp. EMB25]|uniref:DUF2087 domain-containing protein n=1 Tax=Nocardiopsis TaxID=2013 RepID=UPI00034CB613|nr:MULTISPECIES: DUF2087 domain-containing protein [Nocardiopsis]MCY9785937.1 DUF2087 domain-containing protein [Nocardiopsis sp. EMB25]
MPHPTQLASSLADADRLALYARVVCAGPDGIPSEEIRSGGARAVKRLTRLLRDELVREADQRITAVPDVFREAVEGQRPVVSDPVDALFRHGRLTRLPVRSDLRQAALRQVTDRLFAPELEYTEKQVNTAILTCFDDPSAMRRYLVEEGYLEREDDGSRYRVARA